MIWFFVVNSISSYCVAPAASSFSYQPGEPIGLGFRPLRDQAVKAFANPHLDLTIAALANKPRDRLAECPDVLACIFNYLGSPEDVITCRVAGRKWYDGERAARNGSTEETVVEIYRRRIQAFMRTKNFFGAEDWERCGFKVARLRLPIELGRILEGPCLYFEGKQVKDTHTLVLVPNEINGIPFTINNFRGHAVIQYRSFDLPVKARFENTSPDQSYLVFMTQDVIPGSRYLSFDDQQKLVHRVPGYEVPDVLSVIAVIFAHRMKSGKMLYPDDTGRRDGLSTFTRCQEETWTGGRVAVGGLGGSGLNVNAFSHDYKDCGVGALRKFPGT